MFNYTFNTWLLSNLLHPIFFITFGIIKAGFPGLSNTEIFTLTGYVFLISLFISIPCLFLGWFSVKLVISSTAISDDLKFIIWLFLAPFLAFVEFLILLIILDLLESDLLLYSLPGTLAAAFSILIRYPQFNKIIYTSQIDNHETNLV
jgi:hypothetical protein